MLLSSHAHISGIGLFRLHLWHLRLPHQRGPRWSHQTQFFRTPLLHSRSSVWNTEWTFWICKSMNLWSFAGNVLQGWGWCQILNMFHVVQTLKIQNGNSEKSPLPSCHPSFHPIPTLHNWLLLLVSLGSFQSSFTQIQANVLYSCFSLLPTNA